MRLLGKIKPGVTFSAEEVVEEQITFLIQRMFDFMQLTESEPHREIIGGWRDELTHIRHAVYKMLKDHASD